MPGGARCVPPWSVSWSACFPAPEAANNSAANGSFVPMAPLILGFVLGEMMEQNLRRALSITNGKLGILWESPISIALWICAAVMVTVPLLLRVVSRRRRALAAAVA